MKERDEKVAKKLFSFYYIFFFCSLFTASQISRTLWIALKGMKLNKRNKIFILKKEREKNLLYFSFRFTKERAELKLDCIQHLTQYVKKASRSK